MTKDSLGDRMKRNYEDPWRITLPWRMPLIIRVDGRAFHTLTRRHFKDNDPAFADKMIGVAAALLDGIDSALLAYVQSDEVSVLVHNYKRLESLPWFGNNAMKICSVAACMAANSFNCIVPYHAEFDARAFVLPEAEVNNYFLWRQQDAIRNSVASWAQARFSAKQLHGKNIIEQKQMCEAAGAPWESRSFGEKFGWTLVEDGNETSATLTEVDFRTSTLIDNLLADREE